MRAHPVGEGGERTQELPGFEPQWRDIVHYIVAITEEIWSDAAVDHIRATYADDCVIHTSDGTRRGIEGVIAGTIQSMYAFTDFSTRHVNVAWSEDGGDFYTSHLGFAQSVNTGATLYGPATNAQLARHFVADYVSRDNKIFLEWLARDSSSGILQMGLSPVAVARAMAQLPAAEPLVPLNADAPGGLDGDPATLAGWAAALFGRWNARAFADAVTRYAADAVAYWPGMREASGPRAIASLMIGLLASVPDGCFRVEHVCWSDEGDGLLLSSHRINARMTHMGTDATIGAATMRGFGVAVIADCLCRENRIVEEWLVRDSPLSTAQADAKMRSAWRATSPS